MMPGSIVKVKLKGKYLYRSVSSNFSLIRELTLPSAVRKDGFKACVWDRKSFLFSLAEDDEDEEEEEATCGDCEMFPYRRAAICALYDALFFASTSSA